MSNLSPMDELWAASAEVSGVEILTPDAQAVLKAYLVESWTPDEEDNGGYYKFSHRAGMAAALRAAVGHTVPMDKELRETYLAGYYAGENRQGFDCQTAGLRAVLAKWGKAPLLNIADELEGIKYGTYRCNLEDKPQ